MCFVLSLFSLCLQLSNLALSGLHLSSQVNWTCVLRFNVSVVDSLLLTAAAYIF